MKVVVKVKESGVIQMNMLERGEYAVIVDACIPAYTGIVVYCVYNTLSTVQYVGLTENGEYVWDNECPLLVRKVSAEDLQFVD